jgi:hypothetical protein
VTSTRERTAWIPEAECRDYPDWDEDSHWQRQLLVCGRCPVRQPCLDSALELGTGGVRGGTTPTQRGTRYGAGDLTKWVTMRDGRARRPGGDLLDGIWENGQKILAWGTDNAMYVRRGCER